LKLFLALILLLSSANCFSQDWQTVTTNRVASFEFTGDTYYSYQSKKIRIIKVDSIAVAGNDSLFFNYKSKRDEPNYYCYQLDDTGWIGTSVLIRNNGDNIFFTQNNDSILFKTTEAVGSGWHFFKLGGGNYLLAGIVSAQIETVLGIADSVKTIMLMAKNSQGISITHPLNYRTIKLSKQHGILNPFRYFYFPNDTTHFELSGITNPASGKQLLTAREIYNFDVGDVFQWQGDSRSGNAGQQELVCDEWHVLSKNVFNGGDSVVYMIEKWHYRSFRFLSNPIAYSYTHIIDTTSFQYTTNGGSVDPWPNQWYTPVGAMGSYGLSEQFSDSAFYHNRRMREQSEYFVDNIFPGCITEMIADCLLWDYYYAEGLGNVAIEDWTQPPNCVDYHMVYYQKGSDTWGTPANCPAILGEENIVKSPVKIFPNPFSEEINIEVPSIKTGIVTIEISDATGKIVQSVLADNATGLKISTENLSRGFYVISLRSKTINFHYRLVKN